MSEKKQNPECLLRSKSGQFTGNLKIAVFAVFGIYLVVGAARMFMAGGRLWDAFAWLLIGGTLIFAANFRRSYYLSKAGVVKETNSWFGRHLDLLEWDKVEDVTLITEGTFVTAYFKTQPIGRKVLFPEEQLKEIKTILKKYTPDMEINEINK